MSINYAIFPNNLTEDPEDYVAIPQNVKTINQDELFKEMTVPGGVTETQALAVLHAQRKAIMKKLAQGFSVQTHLNNYRVSISGSFYGKDAIFNPSFNQVNVRVTPRKELKEITENVNLSKVPSDRPMPVIRNIIDTVDHAQNMTLTIGKVGEITGSLLKFDPKDQYQGLYIVDSTGTEHRCTQLVRNKPSSVMFYVPEMPEGEAKLTIRAALNNEPIFREHACPITVNIRNA